MSALARDEGGKEPSVGMAKLAAVSLEGCGGDWDKAFAALRRLLTDDRELYERLIDPIIDDKCWDAIRHAAHRQRKDLQREMATPTPLLPLRPQQELPHLRPPNPDKGVPGIEAMVARKLYNYPLPGGKRLGDATPDDILKAGNYYRTLEATYRREARWFEMIHEAMQGGSCVEKVLPIAALERLRRRAEEE